MQRINNMVYKSVNFVGKLVCFSSIVTFSLIALILLYSKIQERTFVDWFYNILAITKNIGANLKYTVAVNALAIINQWKNFPISDILKNIDVLRLHWMNSLYTNIEYIITEMFVNKRLKFEGLIQKIVFLKNTFVENLKELRVFASVFVIHISEKARWVVHNTLDVFRQIKQSFLHFEK